MNWMVEVDINSLSLPDGCADALQEVVLGVGGEATVGLVQAEPDDHQSPLGHHPEAVVVVAVGAEGPRRGVGETKPAALELAVDPTVEAVDAGDGDVASGETAGPVGRHRIPGRHLQTCGVDERARLP